MKLLSINVAEPREIVFDGKTVRSSIWKEPVSGPVAVGTEGLAGNRQANRVVHGGEWKAAYEALLHSISLGVAAAGCGFTACFTEYDKPSTFGNEGKFTFLFLGPEHANTICRDFPTKRAVQEFLVKNAVAPYKTYAAGLCSPPAEFGPYTADTPVPRFRQPESIHIVVTGGPGRQSQIWPTFPTCQRPISVLVET